MRLQHLLRLLLAIALFVFALLLANWFQKDRVETGLFHGNLAKKTEAAASPETPAVVIQTEKLNEDEVPQLAALSAEYAKLASKVLPCVVSINTESRVAVRPRNIREHLQGYGIGVQSGLGSGFFISSDGLIMTNAHVVKGAAEIIVTTHEQVTYRAEVVGMDQKRDLALLKVLHTKTEHAYLSLADSENVNVGQIVFAVGNPFGLSGTVSQGIISATKRYLNDTSLEYLQTDTMINKGNSGGPLVNIYGEVVGINVSVFTGDENISAWQGIGLAVPSNDVAHSLEIILNQDPRVVGYLGITLHPQASVMETFKNMLGVVVEQVEPDSPAEKAGLSPGDVIVEVNGKPLESPEQVFLITRSTPPGHQLKFTVIRKNAPLHLQATIEAIPVN